jgi:hypothetical protein
MINYIGRTDFISEKPQYLLKKKSRAQTVFGGILSLLASTCISVAIVVILSLLLGRKNSHTL